MLPLDVPPMPDVPVPPFEGALDFAQLQDCSQDCDRLVDATTAHLQVAPPEDVVILSQRFAPPAKGLETEAFDLQSNDGLTVPAVPAVSTVPTVPTVPTLDAPTPIEFSVSSATNSPLSQAQALPDSPSIDAESPEELFPELEGQTVQPELSRPELSQPELSQPELSQPELSQPELSQPELSRPELSRPELSQPELSRPELSQPELSGIELLELESSPSELSEVELPEPELSEVELPEPELSGPELSGPELPEPESSPSEWSETRLSETEFSETGLTQADLTQIQAEVNPDFSPLPVGLNVGQRPVNPAALVVGAEDGSQAIDFDNWRIGYTDVINALRIKVTPLDDGQLEFRTPGFVTILDPDELPNDPDLGLAFSIQDLRERFEVEAEFDINDYAIRLLPTWLGLREAGVLQPDAPVILEGLERVEGPDVSLTEVEQRFDFATRGGREQYPGRFAAVGTLLGGSWYTSLDQSDMGDADTWQLDEFEYLRHADALDLSIGSQSTFWDSSSFADHWGVTVVGRNGFSPSTLLQGGGDVRQRLESNQVGRTITGTVEPGSLVRLVEGFGDRVIAEESVDSSGIYRFNNIQFSNESLGRNYRILVFPDGRLTAAPEIREVTFSSVGGQIPAGTTAWAVSVGWEREREDGFLDGFEQLQGGGTLRYGINESLTLGGGLVHDNGFRGLAELFFQPGDIPLQVAVSGLTGDEDGEWDLDANVRFDPIPEFSAQWVADEVENRLDLDWEFLPGLTAIGVVRSDDPDEAGLQLSVAGRDRFTFARTTLDTKGELRWTGIQRLGDLELNSRGDDVSTFSELNYNIVGDRIFDSGHMAFVNYETRDQDGDDDDNFTGVGWRYRSARRSSDGNAAWEAEVGMGFGTKGNGPFVGVQSAIVPGFLLRARYETVSTTSDESAFRLELVSNLNLQKRPRPGDRGTNFLRNQGGLLVEPFFDHNSNGRRDRDEERYTENSDLLIRLNNQSLRNLRPEVNRQHILFRMAADTYRLDLDPAGYPIDWQADIDAYAVEVNPGSYTMLEIPLVPAYTLAGVVTDADGNPVSGARVEAISAGGDRRFSVTNDAGVYFLERLRQDAYSIHVNQEAVSPEVIQFDPSSERFQERNLQTGVAD